MEDAETCTLDPRSKRSTGGGRSSRGGGKEARVEARRSERQSRRLQVNFARFQLPQYQWSEGEFDTQGKLGSAHGAQGTTPS